MNTQKTEPDPRRVRRDRIFISYRRADSAGHAGRLNDDLTRMLGDRVFMDVADIAPGVDFERALHSELSSCGAVLAVIGPRWREALDAPREGQDYVRLELAQALAQADVRVVPVLMQGASLPAAGQLPADLQPLVNRQATVIRDDRWKDDVANLARELRVALKISRPVRSIAAGGVVVAALAASVAWLALKSPPAPAAFDRGRAHEITLAATTKAASACKPARGLAGECPLVFSFVPDGSVRNVYFASGSCALKAPPFGECALQRLAGVRIPPFDNVAEAEVGLNVVVNQDGSVKVVVDE
ncbi:toll/interleukin-1 receptor domain-containing protein [Variovorax rhizosphaerae]|uniref:Toll/interleukin-1 receptor domain-containing protein n=1 Tax=Variovorax rhizosphaerae TaxID=1836200 RepID=A0ABU8WIH2_9BURK